MIRRLLGTTELSRPTSALRGACLGALALALGGAASPPTPLSAQAPEPAPVTLLVVVDQLRADLLDRYDEVFTGGFRRLRDAGYRFTQATHDHAITLTAPGHATLSTGTHPSRHGVVSNIWIEQAGGERRVVENVVDSDREAIGARGRPGATTAPLERSTIGEWLQAQRPGARVLSVSAKARSAVLMAGNADASVYWYDGGAARFVTDPTWAEEMPRWVEDFQDRGLRRLQTERVWDLEVPERYRGLARADDVDYENDGVDTSFPHDFRRLRDQWGSNQTGWWATTPGLDRATRLLAQAGIEAEDIGEDDVPDLVMISFSQTDVIGHAFGPRSLEQLDNLYRLDRELGELMTWLDDRFGPSGWRMLLTADHGVADAPEQALADGRAGRRVSIPDAVDFEGKLGEVATSVTASDEIQPALIRTAEDLDWIAQAWSFAELLEGDSTLAADSFTALQARSAFPGRATGILGGQGIELRLTEGSLLWTVPRGTTHGSPYLYDRHVPFILFGAGVGAGSTDTPVATVDVAPTLAGWLGVRTPDDLDGSARPAG